MLPDRQRAFNCSILPGPQTASIFLRTTGLHLTMEAHLTSKLHEKLAAQKRLSMYESVDKMLIWTCA